MRLLFLDLFLHGILLFIPLRGFIVSLVICSETRFLPLCLLHIPGQLMNDRVLLVHLELPLLGIFGREFEVSLELVYSVQELLVLNDFMAHVAKECLLFRAEHVHVDVLDEPVCLPLLVLLAHASNYSLHALLSLPHLLCGVPPAGLCLSEADGMYATHPCKLPFLLGHHLRQLFGVGLHRV